MLRLKNQGELDEHQMSVFIQPRPAEELYDLRNDPYELKNLAEDPEYQEIVQRMRENLKIYMEKNEDYVPVLRTPDEFHRLTGAPLPNRQWPRPSKEEMFKGCNCFYQSPSGFFEDLKN